MKENEIVLSSKQKAVVYSGDKETFMITGLGGGKSFTLGAFLYKYSSLVRGSVGFLGAPTLDVLKEATWKQVQESWDKMGVREDVDYVVNVRPPVHWGVLPFSKLSSNRIVTFRWGSYIVMDGMENFNKRRGAEYDFICLDEFRDIKQGAREVLLGRLRGKAFRDSDIKSKIVYATTPPENPLSLKQMYEADEDDVKFVMGTSRDNSHNLPKGYIESLIARYDEETKRREIDGELLVSVKDQFAYKYNEKVHSSLRAVYNRGEEYTLSLDFNVDPLTCIAAHTDGETYVRVFKEFRIKNGDIYALAKELEDYFGENIYDAIITGDATEQKKNIYTKGNLHAYQIMENELGLYKRQFQVPSVNPSVSNTRVLLNSLLQNLPEFIVNTDECEHLLIDLQFVEVERDRNGKIQIKKSGKNSSYGGGNEGLTHLIDCLRYLLKLHFSAYLRTKRND